METFGLLDSLSTFEYLALAAALLAVLSFQGARLWLWTLCLTAFFWFTGATWAWILFVPLAILLNVRPLRCALISQNVLQFMKKQQLLPEISQTERTAIEAGTVWIDRDLFSGKPDFKRLLKESYPSLTAEEQEFLDTKVEEVCKMTNDWQVTQNRDLPTEVWTYLKENGFFGMIIPKEFGGLGFSALAHSAVIQKLSSRSMPLSITVMVPNSLGPAELLLHFGTDEQRQHFLPRLARGEEMPCFALTEPQAGSDAGAISSRGEVFKGEDGKLYLRLNWDKRYITLASISTVLGLAFHLEDPDNLCGQGEHPGITCALIPTTTEGVVLGQRHDPLGIPFYNCPTQGHDVIVPMDAIIGGAEGAGKGWRMLMECLAAGRGISLPATSTGGAKLVSRVAGAYAAVRRQFGLSIGKFEGIEEPLARIGGFTYLMEAARTYTCGALDSGAKPPVVTAIAKLSFTELYRKVINDGMDVLGGAAISRGPNNLLAQAYIGTPISITVEGANILTRTMIIFGQGAIRCHPHAFNEIEAASKNDTNAFDRAFFSHVGHVIRNFSRSVFLNLSRGYLSLPPVSGPTAKYYRKLSWASAAFATMSDIAMGTLGGNLKRKEKLTGRFADILSWMYLGTAVLRRYEAEGRKPEDLPFVHWSMQYGQAQMEEAFQGLFQNMRIPVLGSILRGPVALWARLNPLGSMPSDHLGSKVARALQQSSAQRDTHTQGIFLPTQKEEALGRLEHAFELHLKTDAIVKKIKTAVRKGDLPKARPAKLIAQAVTAGVISQTEADLMQEAEQAQANAIAVDSFDLEEYLHPQVTETALS